MAILDSSINKLHIHYWLIRLAEHITTTFWVIILYKMWYEIYQVFLIWSSCFLVRAIIRNFIPFLISKFGLKNIVIFWTILYIFILPIFYFTTLKEIPTYIYVIFFSLTTAIYWYPFHTLYWIVWDSEKRWKQSAIREAYARIWQIISPFLIWIILKNFWNYWTFIFWTIIFIIALIVLINFKEKIEIKVNLNLIKWINETKKYPFYMSFFYSFWEIFFDFVWFFVIYLLFNEDVSLLWLFISIAMIFRIIIDYLIWHHIDIKKKIKWYYYWIIVIIFAILCKVFFWFTIFSIIIFDLLLVIWYWLFMPYESVLIYNSIKDAKYPEYSSLIWELWWDLWSIFWSLIVALLSYNWFELRNIIPIWFITLILTLILYNKYFGYIYKK